MLGVFDLVTCTLIVQTQVTTSRTTSSRGTTGMGTEAEATLKDACGGAYYVAATLIVMLVLFA